MLQDVPDVTVTASEDDVYADVITYADVLFKNKGELFSVTGKVDQVLGN